MGKNDNPNNNNNDPNLGNNNDPNGNNNTNGPNLGDDEKFLILFLRNVNCESIFLKWFIE